MSWLSYALSYTLSCGTPTVCPACPVPPLVRLVDCIWFRASPNAPTIPLIVQTLSLRDNCLAAYRPSERTIYYHSELHEMNNFSYVSSCRHSDHSEHSEHSEQFGIRFSMWKKIFMQNPFGNLLTTLWCTINCLNMGSRKFSPVSGPPSVKIRNPSCNSIFSNMKWAVSLWEENPGAMSQMKSTILDSFLFSQCKNRCDMF